MQTATPCRAWLSAGPVLLMLIFCCACSGAEQPSVPLRSSPDTPAELEASLKEDLQQALREVMRSAAEAPGGQQNRVDDLSLEATDATHATLDWTYRSIGDYDQNSEVNISDLTSIGLNIGKSEASADWQKARLADGDGNGLITIADVTPIGVNYGNRLSGYSVRRASAATPGTFSELLFVPHAEGAAAGADPRLHFSVGLSGLADGDRLIVVPVDTSDGSDGTASVEVAFASGLRPQNVIASQGSLPGAIQLSWDSVAGATGYSVQRRHPSLTNYEELAQTDEVTLSYSDTDVQEGLHRFYRVSAVFDGIPGTASDSVEGWSMTRPAIPLLLQASDGTVEGAVQLDWQASSGADGYRIYRDGETEPLVDVAVTTYLDSSPLDPSEHLYSVSAYNAAGEGSKGWPDNGSSGFIPPPPADFSASLAVFNDHVALSWSGIAYISGYRIYRDTADNLIAEPGKQLVYDDNSLVDFAEHHYWISAYTPLGEGSLAGPVSGSRLASIPDAPLNLQASQGEFNGKVRLNWEASAGATEYLVYRDGSGTALATLADVSSYDDTALPDFAAHSYQVTARNIAGESTLSNAASGYPDNRSEWWRFGRDNSHSALASVSGPATNALAWSYPTGSWIRCNPVMAADGTVYFGNYAGKLVALMPDGSERWTYSAGLDIYTSPAIARDGTIYVGSHDFKLHAVHPDGSQAWTYTTGGIVRSSPAIDDDGRICFGSQDTYLYCLNSDGSLAWKFKTGEEVRSSPAIGTDGTVYVGSGKDNQLNAINADGTLKWKYNAGGWVRSSPAIAANGTIYVGSSNGKLHAVNPDGSQQWVFSATDYIENCSPAIGKDGRVYIGSGDNKLYCINPDTGLEIWHYTCGGDIDGSPAIGDDGTIYVGSDDFKLHAVNANGTMKWTYATAALVDSGALVGQDGRIYFGSSDGSLYCVGPLI